VKKIFKKNQVIITALAIMIAVAGYINYSDSHLGMEETLSSANVEDTTDKDTSTEESTASKDTAATTDLDGVVEDIDSLDYDLTDETALLEENSNTESTTETPGEAVLTGASAFVAQAKIDREQVRASNKETLLEIINNTNLSDEQKQEATASMVQMTDLAEQESAAELMLQAKGFENVVVNLTGDTADVIVSNSELDDAQRAQIEDVIKSKTNVAVENIVITPLSTTDTSEAETSSADVSEDAAESNP